MSDYAWMVLAIVVLSLIDKMPEIIKALGGG